MNGPQDDVTVIHDPEAQQFRVSNRCDFILGRGTEQTLTGAACLHER